MPKSRQARKASQNAIKAKGKQRISAIKTATAVKIKQEKARTVTKIDRVKTGGIVNGLLNFLS